ncbi:MAG: metal-sulfur cluster assembly factor [Bowdeniella nasicola]|nr:metal-sulfur cluster assembly factor [Bowdeniella nasicola]
MSERHEEGQPMAETMNEAQEPLDAPVESPAGGGSASPVTAADIEEALRDVIDPELGINIVDLGLLYGVQLEADGTAVLDMTLTSAACPLTDVIEDQTASCLEGLVHSSRINWVWMPPWGPEKITPEGREQLRALGFNV